MTWRIAGKHCAILCRVLSRHYTSLHVAPWAVGGNDGFYALINGTLDTLGARPLQTIVYGDEMTPGNPLRPDEGRGSWQWSFSIVEFPNHVLHSHAGWIHITTLRSSVLKKLTGGVPMLAKHILHTLFLGTHNFADGFYVKAPGGGMRPIRATIMGFLADEKGLKEILLPQRC